MVLLGTIENICCLAKNGLYKCQYLRIGPLPCSTNRISGYDTGLHKSDVIALLIRLLDMLLHSRSNEKRLLYHCTV